MPLPVIRAAVLLMALPLFQAAAAQTIALDKEDATVWAQEQVAGGTISGATTGTLYVNGEAVPFTASGGRFAVPLRLAAGETEVVACADGAGGEVCADTLRWTLGYRPRPEAELRPTVAGRLVTLTGRVLDNPDGPALTFAWAEDPRNPAPLGLAVQDDSTAVVAVPDGAPPGEYYFDWTVRADDGGARTARTFVTVEADGAIRPFVLEADHAAWIDDAVVYGIAPFYFERGAPNRFDAITAKLPGLALLGVNTIWLQPIYPTAFGGQAYDVTDYFGVWSALGTEDDLRELIDAAHALGMRVLFDLVPNHTSIEHPYARDAVAHGERSHYYDFYQREFDDAPYSEHYHYRHEGAMTFVYYFWEDLVNLNYDNPEVRRYLTEASRYWIEAFGIDGYRVDAVWGVDARASAFVPAWRLALKREKPEVLLLGEDKATRPVVFDERFDAAYDWYPEASWISHWTWLTDYTPASDRTIFNHAAVGTRAARLRDALTNRGAGWAPDAKVLRFMENNDTARFIASHDLARTKMAGALLFSLPGIPLVYNGQEIGRTAHPYETFTIFGPGPIPAQDSYGLFPYYQHLILLRERFPALRSAHQHLAEIAVTPAEVAGRTFAYRRWEGEHNAVAAINMGSDDVTATLALPVGDMGLDPGTTYYLTDLVTGQALAGTGAALAEYDVAVPAYTTRLFAVADSVVSVPVVAGPPGPPVPDALALEPNYPNPFSGRTTVAFTVARGGPVRLVVFDLLGREVARLVDGELPAGRHTAVLDGTALASGVYVCRLESEGQVVARRVALVR